MVPIRGSKSAMAGGGKPFNCHRYFHDQPIACRGAAVRSKAGAVPKLSLRRGAAA